MNHYESRILGYILNNRTQAKPVLKQLKMEYLTDGPAKDVLNCILSYYELKKEIPSVILTAKALEIDEGVIRSMCEDARFITEDDAEIYVEMLRKDFLENKYKQEIMNADADKIVELGEKLSRELGTAHKEYENVLEYLQDTEHGFMYELERSRQRGIIKTGLDNFDAELEGIYEGLYVVGAISSLGKTTLMYQIADNIAASGIPVYYFSLEMSRLELTTKSISRIVAQNCIKQNKSGKDFESICKSSNYWRRNGINTDEGRKAVEQYRETIGPNMYIFESDFGIDVFEIRQRLQQFKRKNPDKPTPVVFVDYLQIMKPVEKGTTKDNIDLTVTELKRISRDFCTPVIVISSFNRSNYMVPVAFESFKESGGIEYTADVVIGLQLAVLDDKIFESDKNIKEKRNKINAAKEENPRKIKLVILKNRYGAAVSDMNFEYNPKCDLFLPAKKISDTVFSVTADTPKGYTPRGKRTEIL